jgi:tRNA U34 2-thiouridine synthase MnmA/TrmU
VDAEANAVSLAREELMAPGLIAEELSSVSGDAGGRFRAAARIRYRSEPAPATVTVSGARRRWFDTPQRAVTPGQAVVSAGDGDRGGTIVRRPDAALGFGLAIWRSRVRVL